MVFGSKVVQCGSKVVQLVNWVQLVNLAMHVSCDSNRVAASCWMMAWHSI